MAKSHSQLIWEAAKGSLRQAVTGAWQSEMVKTPDKPDQYATAEEMRRWTSAARKRLIAEIDTLLKEAVENNVKPAHESEQT